VTAGIICEYDPFHLGHAWHISATRRRLGPDSAVVCCMSGHWTQRADCAIADKWTRAGLALAGGADLVLELPLPWALSSAEGFARGAVDLLAASGGVDVLSFGSECGELAPLRRAAAGLDAESYRCALRGFLQTGASFAAARQAAAEAVLGAEGRLLSAPNNNLGVEYLRALEALDRPMEAMTVLRRGAGHHSAGAEDGFAPATRLRGLLRAGNAAQAAELMPPGSVEALGEAADLKRVERAILARLRTMEEADFAALPDGGGSEGLPARLYRAARQAGDLAEFYGLAKTKRYSHARLRRLTISAFLGLTAADRPASPPYLRVLGLNERGRAVLRRMKAACSRPILTKPAQGKLLPPTGRALLQLEARATDLYGLCFSTPRPCGLEWTRSPVVKRQDTGAAAT